MSHLASDMIDRLKELGVRLIDQRNARILVPALGNESGFWFGGGNLLQEPDGTILACGRFRNPGDARTGTGSGERGLEFAIFSGASPDAGIHKDIVLLQERSLRERGSRFNRRRKSASLGNHAGWMGTFRFHRKASLLPQALDQFSKTRNRSLVH